MEHALNSDQRAPPAGGVLLVCGLLNNSSGSEMDCPLVPFIPLSLSLPLCAEAVFHADILQITVLGIIKDMRNMNSLFSLRRTFT